MLKTKLRNKMEDVEDEFLNDALVLYFERELAEKISLETLVEDFKHAKDRRVPLWWTILDYFVLFFCLDFLYVITLIQIKLVNMVIFWSYGLGPSSSNARVPPLLEI